MPYPLLATCPAFSADVCSLLIGWFHNPLFFSRISLAETNCPIFSQIGQFLHFYSNSILKTVQINPKLDSSEKLKDNSRADNTGLTDCYIIITEMTVFTLETDYSCETGYPFDDLRQIGNAS